MFNSTGRGGAALVLTTVLAATGIATAKAEGTLRIGMTLADIPLTTGQTDQGGEGQRFLGYTVYDSLVLWDLSSADKPSELVPGLATSWEVDPEDDTRWTFAIREGVPYHDGSTFDAAAAVWNLDKLLDDSSPQYDPKQAAQGSSRIPAIESYRAIDDLTLEVTTKEPDAFLPYQLAWILMSSPAHWEAVDGDWDAYAREPSGTGPWQVESWTPRERAVLVPFEDYWDESRVPQLDQMVLIPIPEPATRTSALLSGQVDWIEAPAPDAIPRLEQAGFVITSNGYPHNWTWHLSRVEGSPWNDERIRKAANLAVDREGLKELLGGMMVPAEGHVLPSSTWFGEPEFEITYDPEAAVALLEEAGYGPDDPVQVKTLISASGSGQMLPLPMNEYIQQTLGDVGIDVEFEVVEWNTMVNLWRAGAKSELNDGNQAINFTYFIQDPFTALIRHLDSTLVSPDGTNWGWYQDEEMDALFEKAKTTFDPEAQNAVLQEIHEKFVNEALFLYVTHDVAPRAMSPQVQGFVQAQNWYQNFSGITMGSPQ